MAGARGQRRDLPPDGSVIQTGGLFAAGAARRERPEAEFIAPIPYTGLQQILDEAAPWGILAYQKRCTWTR